MAAPKPINLLLVEDNEHLADILATIFVQHRTPRFHMKRVKRLDSALDSLRQTLPDVVLLDLGLPDSDGLETFTKVHDRVPAMPIVVMTADDDERLTVEAVRKGAQDYLVKGTFDGKDLPRILGFAIERKRAQRELQSAEERYRTVFENSAVAIFVADAKERVVSWNRVVEELLGMRDADLRLKPVKSLYPEEEWKKIRSYEIRRKGEPRHIESKMIRSDGSIIDVEVSITVLKDAEGNITGSIGITKNITERKKAELALKLAEERYRTIFENSAVAITVTNAEEEIISWNHFAENLLGMNREDLYRKPVSSLYPAEEWKMIRAMNVRQKGIEHNLETKVIRKDGGIIDISISISILRDEQGTITGSIGIIKDITKAKRAEEKLKKVNEELVKNQARLIQAVLDVEKTHKELKDTQAQLIQAEKLESVGRLAAGIAHEVKNPLGILLQGIDFVTSEMGEGNAEIQAVLADMNEAVDRASLIINGLLDFSTVSKLQIEPGNLNKVLDSSLLLVKSLLVGQHVEVIREYQEDLPDVRLDHNWIEQVFVNLLTNAMHAMNEGGKVYIKTRYTEDNMGQRTVEAQIRDTGKGIPDNIQDKIFDPFFTTRRGVGGTGLGLSVVRNIVDMHGGQIELRNHEEGGACAVLTFEL
ncbi:MAG: PAS domain S-box protein [Candidatus Omnitrophota bacterium]|nr:PAS domain S-box protein [Candidatus Omnitrophota bacterium]